LQKILVPEGQTVPIGQTIAIIGDGATDTAPAEAAPAPATKQAAAPPAGKQQAPSEEGGGEAVARTTAEARAPAQQPAPATAEPQRPAQPQPPFEQGDGKAEGERIKASPLARRIAAERGIDLRQVQGTGPGGRIIKENVESFSPQGQPAQAAPAPPAPAAQQA